MKYISIINLIIGLAIGAGVTVGVVRTTQPEIPACPTCPACPPATEVKLQDFNAENLRKIKGDFTYSPQLSNVVVKIECADSVMLKALLNGN